MFLTVNTIQVKLGKQKKTEREKKNKDNGCLKRLFSYEILKFFT